MRGESKKKIGLNAVTYLGYAYTGATVAGLVLKEFSGITVPRFKSEFRLIRERGGLLDLERAIFTRDPEIIGLAVRDFKWLCDRFAEDRGIFSRAGFGYDCDTGGQFSRLASEFIQNLSSFDYRIAWHYHDFEDFWPRVIARRFIKKAFLSRNFGAKNTSMVTCSHDAFYHAASEFLYLVLSEFATEHRGPQDEYIYLHKAVAPYSVRDIEHSRRFFNDLKLIVVDRDPRDTFAQVLMSGKGRYLNASDDATALATSFIQQYNFQRAEIRDVKALDYVLFLNFEDFCLQYDHVLDKMCRFLRLNEGDHVRRFTHFNPASSVKNVGIWKTLSGKFAKAAEIIDKNINST
jgi:hypothetical protein